VRDRRKSLLVNLGEAETDAILRDIAEELGVRIFVRPRLADVVEIFGSGISDPEYSFALRAHLDFVVADPDGRARFAVEFDGPYHDTADARRRDAMKNRICQHLGLPLLRIDADYLRTVKGFRLLAWLVDLWFMEQAFYEAQERGEIPLDEPFSPYAVMSWNKPGTFDFRYDLASDARRALWRAYEERRCPSYGPDLLYRTAGDEGEAYAVLRVSDSEWLISHVQIRGPGFASLTSGELAGDLATVEVAAKFEEFERGVAVTARRERYEELLAKTATTSSPTASVRWSFGVNGLNAPPAEHPS
jgi:hypothetical protein